MIPNLRTIDDVMAEQKQDLLILFFKNQSLVDDNNSIDAHFNWLKTNNLEYEQIIPDPAHTYGDSCYVIYFDNPADPRIYCYSEIYEDNRFISLKPELYQMYLYNYQAWYENRGRNYLEDRKP